MPTVLSAIQLECLASPACSTVFMVVRAMGRASAAEVANRIGRSPATVTYHLRRLLEAELIRVIEKRAAKRKPEAIYGPTDERYELPAGKEVRALRVKAVQAGLRQAIRGWERASLKGSGSMQVIRAQVRLKPEDQKKLEAMLEAASRFAKENESPDGELHAWTSVIYPDSFSTD